LWPIRDICYKNVSYYHGGKAMTVKKLLKNGPATGSQQESANLLAEDFMLPAMVIKETAIVNNSAWMQEYADKAGVKLAPHGKTTMCPALFKKQLANGAWGMTLANAFQVRVAHEHGVKKILMANQLVGRQNILQVLHEINSDDELEFHCLVDNTDNIKALAEICRQENMSKPLNVLIEIAPAHGRAGVRTSCEVIELAHEVRRNSPWLQLSGIECYEGVIHCENPVPVVDEFLSFVAQTAVEVEALGLFDTEKLILTGGGTVFFDRVCEILGNAPLKTPFDVLIRPGCYLSHDSGIYDEFQNELVERDGIAKTIDASLESAIEVLTYVQSIPEPGLAILTMGKRDVSFDSGLPTPYKLHQVESHKTSQLNSDWYLSDLNDQHAFMKFPASAELKVGDILISQVSHPCLTFDKWQAIALVDEDYNVNDMLTTYFG
jgi:D-serine dehydratase